MAWTAPRTWVDGADVVAAMMNEQVRDNLKAISDPWTAYTPTLSGTGWAVGNGTLSGGYWQVGKRVDFRIDFLFGSTTTKGASASPVLTLPVTMKSGSEAAIFNAGLWVKASSLYFGFAHIDTTTYGAVSVYLQNTSGTASLFNQVTSTTPASWTTNDIISVHGTYEAA